MRMRSAGMVVAAIVAIQLFASIATARAQSKADKPAAGSISGIVKIDGVETEGVGVVIFRTGLRGTDGSAVFRTRSGTDGSIRFEGLPPGHYRLNAYAAGAVVVEPSPWSGRETIPVAAGESVEDLSVELVRGGVITGKLADRAGNPIAAQSVVVMRIPGDSESGQTNAPPSIGRSDDRGVYRIYGLPTGKYFVYAGEHSDDEYDRSGGREIRYRRSYFGSAKIEEARRVEVTVGSEATDVDIVLTRASAGYAVSGRVVDAGTGKAVSGGSLILGPLSGGRLLGQAHSTVVRDDGGFRFDSVAPGTYGAIAISTSGDSASYFGNLAEVTITDREVEGLVAEVQRAATIRGTIAFVQSDRLPGTKTLDQLSVVLLPLEDNPDWPVDAHLAVAGLRIEPDGSFVAKGIRPGRYSVSLGSMYPAKGIHVARVDVKGKSTDGIVAVSGQEEIDDVRILIGRSRAVIRGRVKVRGSSIAVEVYGVCLQSQGFMQRPSCVPIDSGGAFLIESASPGPSTIWARGTTRASQAVNSQRQSILVPVDGVIEMDLELDVDAGRDRSGEVP